MPFALVLFDGVRSAEPPSSSGMAVARWSSTAPLAERVAISLPLAMNSAPGGALALLPARNELGWGRRDRHLPVGRQLPVVPALELGPQFSWRRLDAVCPSHVGL